MKVFNWLRKGSNPNEEHQELLSRMTRLEEQLHLVLKETGTLKDYERSAIVIQNVERIIVEKLEHSNHFGTLEIQDLAGRLNIGLNVTAPIPDEVLNSFAKKHDQAAQFQKDQPDSPRCTIRPKSSL